MPIRILLVDDHPVVRDGLAAMLATQPDFSVVGAAGNGAEAITRVAELQPDLVLLDLEMPELGGVDAIGGILASSPNSAIIVFTAFDRDEQILGALEAGARGYLLKGAPREEVFRAIRTVAAGGSLMVAARLLDRARQPEGRLTAREREVLRLLAQGQENKRIARALGVTERTVKFHVGALLRKLGAANRTAAVTTARDRGLV